MEDRTASIIAVIAVFQGLSIIAISVRMYTRKYIVRLIGWDDSWSHSRLYFQGQADILESLHSHHHDSGSGSVSH